MQGTHEQLTTEIAQLEAGVKALDEAVADATAIRKEDNADYKQLMSDDSTAKENRLNQFYNPNLYKPPPKRELTGEERITENMGGVVLTQAPGGIAGTGIGAFVQMSAVSKRKGCPATAARDVWPVQQEVCGGPRCH